MVNPVNIEVAGECSVGKMKTWKADVFFFFWECRSVPFCTVLYRGQAFFSGFLAFLQRSGPGGTVFLVVLINFVIFENPCF